MDLDVFLTDHVATSVQQTTFFHFTDTRNLDLIKKHGLLSRRKLKEMGISIPAPGGNQWSIESADRRGLDRYVSLCLTASHPMEFQSRQGGQIKEAVYLGIKPHIIKVEGAMMTAGVSNKSGVDLKAPGEVLDELDLEVIYRRTDWNDSAIKERRKVAQKFEILVPDQVPLEYILNI